MRIIPVIDLSNGRAVHAAGGERDRYRPVRSVLSASPDPLAVADAFRRRMGLDELYIADLDAIAGRPLSRHRRIIDTLARRGFGILLDAGAASAADASFWAGRGVRRVVVGSETLETLGALEEIAAATDPDRIVFSLDCRGGRVLSRCSDLDGLPPARVLARIRGLGLREAILLDLGRVGAGCGADRALAAEARALFPDMVLLAGGGIAGPGEIRELEALGIDGVLVATALHRGALGARDARRKDAPPSPSSRRRRPPSAPAPRPA